MPSYKLTYFAIRARAELTRLIFAQAGVQYEDKRVSREGLREEWASIKPTTPWGQLPLLEIDGKLVVSQSIAIARYVARETGLTGKDSIEELLADSVVASCVDLFNEFAKNVFEKDEAKKAENNQKNKDENIPTFLKNVEKFLSNNKCGGTFVVGNALTWADLAVFDILFAVKRMDPRALNAFPKVAALDDRVGNLPNIKKWVETRPVTYL